MTISIDQARLCAAAMANARVLLAPDHGWSAEMVAEVCSALVACDVMLMDKIEEEYFDSAARHRRTAKRFIAAMAATERQSRAAHQCG